MRLLIIGLLLSVSASASAIAKSLDRIVAVVNDELITQSDLTEYRQQLKKEGLIDKALLTIKDPQKLLSNNDYLLEHLIDERLMDSEIKRLKLTATIEQVEREIRNITSGANQGRGLSRSQLKQALKQQGVNFSDYQDFIRKTLERRGLIEKEIKSQVIISDDEVTAYYINKYGMGDTKAFEYHLSHMLFLNSNGGPEETKKRAEAALSKLSGESFSSVAEQFSEDPNFSSGGFMGAFKSGEMRPEVETMVKDLGVGKNSALIKTNFGYQIVFLKKKSLIENPQVQQKKMMIRNVLMGESINSQLKSWLKRKRESAFIKINKKS